MKIAVIWWFDKAEWVYPNWRDGHRAAFEEVGKKHDLDLILGKRLPDYQPEFLLFWDDSNSEVFNHLDKYSCRKGICLTTWPHNMDNIRKLDVVFCESKPIYDYLRANGVRVILAFGTDTDFYTPYNGPKLRKDIEYFYPATFSPWKRQSEIAHLGKDLVCIGTVQPDGLEELRACRENGVMVIEGYLPAEVIRDYYRRAKKVIIPAVHGSERTVLEAMSCDIWPEVMNPDLNQRAASYIVEYLAWRNEERGYRLIEKDGRRISPRQFILDRYNHKLFADNLLRGIES